MELITEAAKRIVPQAENLLDIGCGEGYYSDRLIEQIKQTQVDCQLWGLDISKTAVKYAAKKYCKNNKYYGGYWDSYIFLRRRV